MRRAAGPALATGLVLADSSVVTLALPEILRELDATVAGVAWVLIAFNLALALAAVPAAGASAGRERAGLALGLAVFAATCLACAVAPSLEVLIVARALQGIAGAVVVAAALERLLAVVGDAGDGGGASSSRAIALWGGAGIVGAAVGPAAGGVLTEALSWEAMFALQAPVALAALGLALPGRRSPPAGAPAEPERPALAPLAGLALVSAALSAALFLVVLLLIEGWRHSPAEAALTVTAMPVAALLAPLAARRLDPVARAAAGVVLIAGGLAALGLLPGADPWLTVPPQLLVGAGLGLSVTALTTAALHRRDPVQPAAWTIAARHAGVVAGLLLLTPVFTADLETQQHRTEEAGLALLLDADLAVTAKLRLARGLDDVVRASPGQVPDLAPAFAAADAQPEQQPVLAGLRAGMEEQLDRAGTAAFSRSFLVAAGLALLALVALAAARRTLEEAEPEVVVRRPHPRPRDRRGRLWGPGA